MKGLLAVVSLLATLNIRRSIHRVQRTALFSGIAGLLFYSGWLFLCFAAVIALARHMGLEKALLALAFAAFLLGIVLMLVKASLDRHDARKAAERQATVQSLLAMGAASLPVRSSLLTLLVGGVAASGLLLALRSLAADHDDGHDDGDD